MARRKEAWSRQLFSVSVPVWTSAVPITGFAFDKASRGSSKLSPGLVSGCLLHLSWTSLCPELPGLYRWWKWLIVTLVNVDLKASWQRFPESAGNFSSLHSTENEDPWMLLKKHPNHQRISPELWNISSVQSGKAASCCIGPSAPHALQKSLHV